MRCGILGLVALALATQFAALGGPSIHGRVIHAITKEPLRGAIVLATGVPPDASAPHDAACMTGADGTFTLPVTVLPDSLRVTKTGFLETRVRPDVAGESPPPPLVIALMPSGVLSGQAIDAAGDPVRGAFVRAARKGETLEARARRTTADDRGRYVIDGLEPGEYIVTAGRTDGDTMTRPPAQPTTATVEAGQERDDANVLVVGDVRARAAALSAVADGVSLAKPPPPGTASIAGTVRDRRGRGLALVIVTAWQGTTEFPLPERPSWSAVTDEAGAYRIERLPAGAFSVVAHRPSIGPPYGTSVASDPVGRVQLADGQHRTDVAVTVREGASIAGVIRDEFGDPVRANVVLLLASAGQGVVAAGSRTTDDRGRYRFANLRPNPYIVMASRATTSPLFAADDAIGRPRLVGTAQYFHPGVPSIDMAALIAVDADAEREGIDVSVAYEPVADVDISILPPAGSIEKILASQVSLHGRAVATSHADNRGASTVTFRNVTAGHWRFALGVTVETVNGRETQWATHEVTTDGMTSHSATLTLEPGARIAGTIVYDDDRPALPAAQGNRERPVTFMMSLSRIDGIVTSRTTRDHSTREPGRTFEFSDVMPGTYTISAAEVRAGSSWRVRSAMLNGRDLLDFPLPLSPAADVSGVVLTMSTRATQLSGIVRDAVGRPLGDLDLVIVAADPRYQFRGSRRIRNVRTRPDGSYSIRDLPPGEYRIGAAPAALTGAALLQVPRPLGATAVTIGEGERKIQDLTISR